MITEPPLNEYLHFSIFTDMADLTSDWVMAAETCCKSRMHTEAEVSSTFGRVHDKLLFTYLAVGRT